MSASEFDCVMQGQQAWGSFIKKTYASTPEVAMSCLTSKPTNEALVRGILHIAVDEYNYLMDELEKAPGDSAVAELAAGWDEVEKYVSKNFSLDDF